MPVLLFFTDGEGKPVSALAWRGIDVFPVLSRCHLPPKRRRVLLPRTGWHLTNQILFPVCCWGKVTFVEEGEGGGSVSVCPNPSITVYQTVNFHAPHCLPLFQPISWPVHWPVHCSVLTVKPQRHRQPPINSLSSEIFNTFLTANPVHMLNKPVYSRVSQLVCAITCLVWAFRGSISEALICQANPHSFIMRACSQTTCVVHVQWMIYLPVHFFTFASFSSVMI